MPKNDFTCDCTVVHEDAVREVSEKMRSGEQLMLLSDFFKILGDSTRIHIICALKCREMCVCDIANILSMTKSAVSHQLSTLRRCGFVKCRRAGKVAYYSLDDAHIGQIFDLALTHIEEKGGAE